MVPQSFGNVSFRSRNWIKNPHKHTLSNKQSNHTHTHTNKALTWNAQAKRSTSTWCELRAYATIAVGQLVSVTMWFHIKFRSPSIPHTHWCAQRYRCVCSPYYGRIVRTFFADERHNTHDKDGSVNVVRSVIADNRSSTDEESTNDDRGVVVRHLRSYANSHNWDKFVGTCANWNDREFWTFLSMTVSM